MPCGFSSEAGSCVTTNRAQWPPFGLTTRTCSLRSRSTSRVGSRGCGTTNGYHIKSTQAKEGDRRLHDRLLVLGALISLISRQETTTVRVLRESKDLNYFMDIRLTDSRPFPLPSYFGTSKLCLRRCLAMRSRRKVRLRSLPTVGERDPMSQFKSADTHLVMSASANAERSALSLFSVASAVYPGENRNLVNHFIREAIEAGIALGLHGRKLVELCHLKDARISQTRWKYEVDSRQRETSFREATNRFVHARQLRVRTLQYPDKVFGSDIVMTEFIVTTDKREEAYIDIFGFAWGYLSQIAPQMGMSPN